MTLHWLHQLLIVGDTIYYVTPNNTEQQTSLIAKMTNFKPLLKFNLRVLPVDWQTRCLKKFRLNIHYKMNVYYIVCMNHEPYLKCSISLRAWHVASMSCGIMMLMVQKCPHQQVYQSWAITFVLRQAIGSTTRQTFHGKNCMTPLWA
jgi:hypothetical protein